MEFSKRISRSEIAWTILNHLLEKTDKTIPCMTHPCSGQYKCLCLVEADYGLRAAVQINLNGNSILVNNDIFHYNSDMSSTEVHALVDNILEFSKLRLNSNIRKLKAIEFFRELLAKYSEYNLKIYNAWYDSSDESFLSLEAQNFKFYPTNCTTIKDHIQRWTISVKNRTVAICNAVSDKLILSTGKTFDLKEKQRKRLKQWMN
jgi:hypothetical protein